MSHYISLVWCIFLLTGVEFVGPSKRVMTGIPIHMFFAVGLVYLAGVGALVRHWQYLQLAVAVPCIVYVFYWWQGPMLSFTYRKEKKNVGFTFLFILNVNAPILIKKRFGTYYIIHVVKVIYIYIHINLQLIKCLLHHTKIST